MSYLYQTTGIVLSCRDYKEADRWYSVFTPDRGKVEFLARGGHKPLAKLTPHLEMVAVVDLLLVYGRQYQILAGVERSRAFPSIYQDTSKLLLAQSGLHLIDIGTHPQEYDPSVFELLMQWMDFLEKSPLLGRERAAYLLATFSLKLLTLLGYRPELHQCLGCRSTLGSRAFRWHALKGGVICESCTTRDQEQWFSARPMEDDTLKLLRISLQEPFENLLNVHLRGETIISFHEAIESLVICHFPTIPASSLRAACHVC